jgi:hypothetical protein
MFNLQAVKYSLKEGKLYLEVDLSVLKNPANLPLTKSGKSYQVVNSGLITLPNGLMFNIGVYAPKDEDNYIKEVKEDNVKNEEVKKDNIINTNNTNALLKLILENMNKYEQRLEALESNKSKKKAK